MRNKKAIISLSLIVLFGLAILYRSWGLPSKRGTTNQSLRELTASDFVEESKGCEDVTVYKSTKVPGGISVNINIGIQEGYQFTETFEIGVNKNVEILYAEGGNPVVTIPESFCNDFVDQNAKKPKIWNAHSGIVRVTGKGKLERPNIGVSPFDEYYVDVSLEDVRFFDKNGKNEISLDYLEFKNVLVGWYPG